jgi:hypothetical protein
LTITDIGREKTQTRAALNVERVSEYAERMKAGDESPRPMVFSSTKAKQTK